MSNYFNSYFESLSKQQCLLVSLVGLVFLGFFDYLTGSDLSFSVFYTGPIMVAAWYGGRRTGYVVAFVAAAVWFGVDLAARESYSMLLILIWNTLVRLAFFLIILNLLLIVREKLTLEESLADTDPLTGLANRRFFLEQFERERVRVSRYSEPFTVAYIDLDNFKYVNDSMGHAVGDELLQCVAQTLAVNIRSTDFSARLGGDEFAIFFSTLDKTSALSVLENLQTELLAVMHAKAWPVTFSIGAVTFTEVVGFNRDMLKRVDDLMYEVKQSGKNNIRYIIWPDHSQNP